MVHDLSYSILLFIILIKIIYNSSSIAFLDSGNRWLLASDLNFRQSLCRRIFPTRTIVGTRHLRNAKLVVDSSSRLWKIDMIMCIDKDGNILHLARGNSRHVFKAERIIHGEYRLSSGPIPHRIMMSTRLKKDDDESNCEGERRNKGKNKVSEEKMKIFNIVMECKAVMGSHCPSSSAR